MRIFIIGVGGTGCNLVPRFMNTIAKELKDFEFVPMLIDTSDANSSSVGGLGLEIIQAEQNGFSRQGGGKDRRVHAKAIAEQAPRLASAVEAGDAVIIVGSLSGASGSTIKPYLVKELHNRARIVGLLSINSLDDSKSTLNSLDTMTTLDNLPNHTKTPVVMHMVNNDQGERAANYRALTAITLMSILFSGRNNRLDHSDILNFFNFSTVTKYSPRLAFLNIYSGDNDSAVIEGEGSDNAIAVASLFKDADDVRKAPIYTGYSCHGVHEPIEYTAPDTGEKVAVGDVHFIISSANVLERFKAIHARVLQDEEHMAGLAKHTSLSSNLSGNNVAQADDDGFVIR